MKFEDFVEGMEKKYFYDYGDYKTNKMMNSEETYWQYGQEARQIITDYIGFLPTLKEFSFIAQDEFQIRHALYLKYDKNDKDETFIDTILSSIYKPETIQRLHEERKSKTSH